MKFGEVAAFTSGGLSIRSRVGCLEPAPDSIRGAGVKAVTEQN